MTKDNARGLRLTGRSIALQQDAPDFEWLVIDGASTDQTAAVMSELDMPQARFISQPDRNLYDAMNKGLELAAGRYVWFLNAGDCLPDSFVLRDLAREIGGGLPPDFIYGPARESGRIKRPKPFHHFARGMITHHQAMLYRREKIGALRFDEGFRIAADYAFTLRFQEQARDIHETARVLCDFAPAGLSHQQATLGRQENFKIREELLHMPAWKNKLLYRRDALVFALRRKYPKLYWILLR